MDGVFRLFWVRLAAWWVCGFRKSVPDSEMTHKKESVKKSFGCTD